ncbi:hypothetical protein [Superficieibacter sp. HKU1]|uniref:hypothetical protein n=1 Tax=Superficieibacter sp. HKU1 TaxID=3031919 RepID=UPI0023E17A75|nr:hypothetical protein [Superficieibacter sp. HKU1]WES69424.1 hypothetical protein P0H77_05320 [Superficieibacter sp. HKU1]
MPKELSGAQWVSYFPGSSFTNDLQGTFRSSVKIFYRRSTRPERALVLLQRIALLNEHTGADGKNIVINMLPRTGMNAQLHAVGKGYGVIKLSAEIQINLIGQLMGIEHDITLPGVIGTPVNGVRFQCPWRTPFTAGCAAFSE